MSFLKDIGNFFGGLFGGNNDQKKKRQDSNGYSQPSVRFSGAPVQNASNQDNLPTGASDHQSQRPDNGLNLVLPSRTPSTPAGFPTVLKKAQPAPSVQQGQTQQSPQNQPQPLVKQPDYLKNIQENAQNGAVPIHDITHNPVTDTLGNAVKLPLQFSENYANTFANLGHKAAGNSNQSIQQNMGTDPFNRGLVKLSGATGTGKQLAGDIGQIGLSIAAPGADALAQNAGTKILPTALQKVVPRVISNAAIGGGFNAASAAGEGANKDQVAKSAIEGSIAGGLFGGATSLLSKADHPGINSTNPDHPSGSAAPRDVTTGAQGTNTVSPEAQAASDINVPAFQRKAEAAAPVPVTATDANAVELGAGSTQRDTVPAFQHKQNIQKVIDQGNQELTDYANANPNLSPQELDQARTSITAQVAERIDALQKERFGPAAGTPQPGEVVAPARAAEAAPVPGTPAATPEPTIAQLSSTAQRPAGGIQKAIEDAHNAGDNAKVAELIPQLPPDMQEPMKSALGITDTTPPAAATPPTPAAPASPALPEIPKTSAAPTGPQVPVAPRTREAAMKQLGDLSRQLPGDGKMRDVTNLEQLANDAQGVVANLSPEEVVNTFGSRNIEALPNDAKSFAVLRAARDKLSELAKADPQNGDIKDAIANTIDEMATRASGNGLMQRVVQEEFDAMPLEAKVRYLAKKIDQANRDTRDYAPLAQDPAKLAEVNAALTNRLQASQDIAERISGLENQLNNAADAATRGEKVDVKATVNELKRERTNLQTANGEVVKYFQSLIPGRTKAQRALVDFPKRMMLASFSGRINDVLTTAASVGELQSRNLVQGALAKGYNLIKGRGAVSDAWKGGGKLFGGIKTGLEKFAGESKGNVYVNDVQGNLKGVEDLRSGLRKPSGPVGRTIQAATELATNVTEGVRDQRVYQLADQEAAQMGLKGAFRKQYAEARAAVPTRQMMDAADTLHRQVNNLNDNLISRVLNRVSQAMEGDNKFAKTGIGGVIKNQVLPFTSWLGGNIWNQVTDKNAVAQFTKFLMDAHRGDPEAAIQHLAGTISGAAQGYVLGYQLAQHGMLTDKNAEGYNDGGMYLHIGDRYIPVGQFGFFAPNIVLGKTAFDGLNSNDPAGSIASDIGGYAWNGLALGQTLGVQNNLQRAYDAGTQPGHNAADAAAVFGGGVAGQYIPGLAGDVNTFLNNGIPGVAGSDALNPTHEAANTRVGATGLTPTGRPSQAKDIPASTLASLENRIPFLSQQLPRKAGVAAPDFIDRTTKGDRETQAQKDQKAAAQTEAQRQADFKSRDIPDYATTKNFDNAVEARVERGEYDKAIEAMNAKIQHDSQDKNIPQKTIDKMNDQVKQYQVLKDGKFDPKIRDLYSSTSVSEWRNMGDPNSDTYNPQLYQMLYDYDSALAKAGISGSTLAKDGNKYTAKKPKKTGAGSRGGSRSNPEASNYISNTPDLGKISLGDLTPRKTGTQPIPTIQQISSSDLVKKRKITVGKA